MSEKYVSRKEDGMAKSKGKEGSKEEFVLKEEDWNRAAGREEDRGKEEHGKECHGKVYHEKEGQETDSLGAQVIHNLLCVSRLHRKKIESALAKTELHGSQHRLLMSLSREENVSQTELAKKMEVTPATVAVALKKLEKDGYIQKVVDEADNRYNKIAITLKGQQVILESEQIFRQTDKEFFENFTKEELGQLNQYLLRMKGR